MLTRELLNYRCRNGKVKLDFCPVDDPAHRALAVQIVDAWTLAGNHHRSRGELDEQLEAVLKGARKPVVAAGMHKLMLDHSVWRLADPETDYPAARSELFIAAAAARRACSGDYRDFRERLTREERFRSLMEAGVYPDLPENERLESFDIADPDELLERYNLSMAQSLLLYAEQLELTLAAENVAALRGVFRALKFFRLLARVEKWKPAAKECVGMSGVRIRVEGPLALFGEMRKYGLQLACFFPSAVRLPYWKLSATLKLRERTAAFELDHTCGLTAPRRGGDGYIPEEFRLFAAYFREKATDWRIVEAAPVIPAPPELIVPDFCFARRGSRRKISVELFHRWHATALPLRLEWLKKHLDTPLLLGIDRALLPDGEADGLLAQSPELEGRIFVFRDFPGVDRVRRMLDAFDAP